MVQALGNNATIDELLADLNPQQRQAATHGDGPLLIVAGAGTGKTATLVHRVAWLIAQGVDPGRILLLTFTRRAAAEMLRRAENLLRRLGAKNGAGLICRNGLPGASHKSAPTSPSNAAATTRSVCYSISPPVAPVTNSC